jgi:hypothetical protein
MYRDRQNAVSALKIFNRLFDNSNDYYYFNMSCKNVKAFVKFNVRRFVLQFVDVQLVDVQLVDMRR